MQDTADNLPDAVREEAASEASGSTEELVFHELRAVWSGPMPPPAALAQLDAVVPGLAREVADEFRAEAKHRRRLERWAVIAQIIADSFGYVCAIVFAAACFITIWHAVDKQATAVAIALVSGALVAGIAAFLRVQRRRSEMGDDVG